MFGTKSGNLFTFQAPCILGQIPKRFFRADHRIETAFGCGFGHHHAQTAFEPIARDRRADGPGKREGDARKGQIRSAPANDEVRRRENRFRAEYGLHFVFLHRLSHRRSLSVIRPAQFFASLTASGGNHGPPTRRFHTFAKTRRADSLDFAGLVSSFHNPLQN